MTARSHAYRLVRSLAAAAILCGAALASLVQAQDSLTVPGTSVTLTLPAGFTVARGGKGLDDGAGSTITIGERPADAYPELAALFKSAKNLSASYAAQKITIRAIRQIETPSGAVAFATGTQMVSGREQLKYLALLKGDKTVLITFNVANRSVSEADAEALLRSVALTPAPTLEEQLAGLPFTFEVSEPFRVGVIARGTVTLVTGDDNPASSTQPVIVMGRGQSQALMGDEPRVAVEVLKSTGGFREATITSQGPATFAGGAGYVVTAVVEDRTVVQYLRIVPGGAYLRLLARGQTGPMETAEAAITAIAGSVAPR
jgi:hypothetical protein